MVRYLPHLLLISAAIFVLAAVFERHTGVPANPELLPEFVNIQMETGETIAVTRHEITVRQWNRCAFAGGCAPIMELKGDNGNHPVTGVSWFDIQGYIRWLNSRSERNFRLPTYKEWNVLAGNQRPQRKQKLFDDPRLSWAANYDLTAEPRERITRPAGYYGANEFGILDIRGNVWEWTSSQCEISAADQTDYCRPGRIAMGEHMAILSEFVRDPGNASCGAGIPPSNLGFRLVSG